jgi:hypothetical protein
MRQSLLEIVQSILSDMDGDEVNSIDDTEESSQVARIVRNNYNAMMSNTVWPHTRRALTLIGRSSSSFPTHMRTKEDLKELISVSYNTAVFGETRKIYKPVKYLDPDQFLFKLNSRNSDDVNVTTVIDDSGIELLIYKNKAPEYYTSIDDVNLIFDSYNSEVESTLHTAKMQAQGYIIPVFTMEDSFVPDLPVDAFTLLVERSTSACQYKLRQFQDIKSEAESVKQSRWLSRKAWTVSGGIKYPNYGRK